VDDGSRGVGNHHRVADGLNELFVIDDHVLYGLLEMDGTRHGVSFVGAQYAGSARAAALTIVKIQKK
jgi:hypothetical protein